LQMFPIHSDQVWIHSSTQSSLDNSPVIRIVVQITNVANSSSPNKTCSSQVPQQLCPHTHHNRHCCSGYEILLTENTFPAIPTCMLPCLIGGKTPQIL
jgi:hypothetical protein